MSIKKILKMGHPKLFEKSDFVKKFNTHELNTLIKDMRDTMKDYDGAGLAAPQIGEPLRVVVYELKNSNKRYKIEEIVPFTVLINPQIIPIGNETDLMYEGCLSVPGMTGLVKRFLKIHLIAYNELGIKFEKNVSGFHARVIQHECDHLDGVLYPMRIENIKDFGFIEELAKK